MLSLTFGLFTQMGDSGPHDPLALFCIVSPSTLCLPYQEDSLNRFLTDLQITHVLFSLMIITVLKVGSCPNDDNSVQILFCPFSV